MKFDCAAEFLASYHVCRQPVAKLLPLQGSRWNGYWMITASASRTVGIVCGMRLLGLAALVFAIPISGLKAFGIAWPSPGAEPIITSTPGVLEFLIGARLCGLAW